MVTNAGGGYSRRQQLALTRWREDVTTDAWGSFCYVRDIESGRVWSSGYQPDRPRARRVRVHVRARPGRLPPRRRGIETRTEIVVSPEDDAELRRVVGHEPRHAAPDHRADQLRGGRAGAPHADLAHPAFSNLFVETMARPGAERADLRRAGRARARRHYLVHVLSGHGRGGPARSTRPTGRGSSAAAARSIGRSRCGRRAAVEHHGAGARPDRQPEAVGPRPTGRNRAVHVHDRLCRQ
jgi:cyclic beta-1,2-glucan synthetase